MPYRHCSGLLWIALLCCWIVVGTGGVSVVVTVAGAGLNWTAGSTLPAGWLASGVSRVSVQNATGACPAGRYCPAGTSSPVVCGRGMYSTDIGRSTPCAVKCGLGYYCPDPGKRLACPGNTSSARGASSQLDCRCNAGYECMYKKVLSVSLGLRVPYRVLTAPEGSAMKQALLEAVAETAGVSVGSVKIDRIAPGKSGVGARRLLGHSAGGETTLLSLSVEGGAEGLGDLRGSFRRRKELRRVGSQVHWQRVENLKVLPAPQKSAWDWRAWVARRA